MAELKPCPFCGGNAEVYKRKTGVRFSTLTKSSIPKNGTIEYVKTFTDGTKSYSYRKNEWVTRCCDAACIGRTKKPFPTEAEAIEAWNRRTEE